MSTQPTFKPTSHQHAALAQLHRWYQIYEDLPNAEAHYSILNSAVVVDAATGTTSGLANLTPKLANYLGWQNAHQLLQATVATAASGDLTLSADIVYTNVLPNGTRNAMQVHYEADLKPNEGALPVFTRIKMRPTSVLEPTTFVPAYTINRAQSFLHYWLMLMETGKGDATNFKPLLADSFAVDLGGAQPATSFAEFAAWFKTVPTWLDASAHSIQNLLIGSTPEGLLTLSMQFNWQGIHVDGSPMIAVTEHSWLLEPNLGQPFAAMKRMQVKALVPFQKVK